MFECSKCGLCCRSIHMVPALSQYDCGNGRCQYLTENNLCGIYENRPDICNVDKMYELHFESIMTKEEYYKKNFEGCKELKAFVSG